MATIDFKALEKKENKFNEQYIYKAANGYGASIIRGHHTYGGEKGLWELAVLDSEGGITYDTPITDDVIGWLSDDQVNELLVKISNL